MEKSSLKVTTKAQFERLVQLMEHNPEIARGKPKFGMTKNQFKDLWESFALELNSIGPPTRTSSEWQRVWIHYKESVKKKLANNKQNMQATGGGPSKEIPLNSLEDCVSQLLCLNQQVAPSGQIFGAEKVPPTTSDAPDESIEATRENEILSNIPTKRRNRNCPENE